MHTEDEARQKWCPFARVIEMLDDEPVEGYGVGNRSTMQTSHPHARCLASECMAWRWKGPWEWVGEGPARKRARRGFCGLSGEPNE